MTRQKMNPSEPVELHRRRALAQNTRLVRILHRQNTAQVAEKAGVGSESIRRIEQAESVGVDLADAVSKALGYRDHMALATATVKVPKVLPEGVLSCPLCFELVLGHNGMGGHLSHCVKNPTAGNRQPGANDKKGRRPMRAQARLWDEPKGTAKLTPKVEPVPEPLPESTRVPPEEVADLEAEAAAWPLPKSLCTCGHTGDGPGSQHQQHPRLLEAGHGRCRMALCDCKVFTFKEHLPAYQLHRKLGLHKLDPEALQQLVQSLASNEPPPPLATLAEPPVVERIVQVDRPELIAEVDRLRAEVVKLADQLADERARKTVYRDVTVPAPVAPPRAEGEPFAVGTDCYKTLLLLGVGQISIDEAAAKLRAALGV